MQGKSEVLINSIAGCGAFQVLVSILVYFLANSASAFTMLFMSFGNYNPGWRCNHSHLDNRSYTLDTTNASFGRQTPDDSNGGLVAMLSVFNNSSSTRNNTDGVAQGSFKYQTEDNCPLFESCNDIEFDPTSVTIVSEWGLLCNKQWIPSIISSLQMAGIFVGSFFSGYFGDAFGRKPTLYGAVLATAILNFASAFSPSWEMYATFRFILGLTMSLVLNLYYVFAAEFVPEKWRSVLQGFPAWSVSSTIFTLACMGLRDWRYVTILTACIGLVGFAPVLWVPESLRWLEVKNKPDKFKRAAEKIVSMNGKTLPSMENLQEMVTSIGHQRKESIDEQKYNILHLFKNGYAKFTLLLSIQYFSISSVSSALNLGIKILRGDFYTNLIISYFIIIPFSAFHIFMPNILGRKMAGLIFSGLLAACLLAAAILEYAVTSVSVKNIAIPTLVFTGNVAMSGVWCVLAIFAMELYPTVVRGLGMSWGSTMARAGGVIAPFLISNTADGAAVTYSIMAALSFACFGVFLVLPETKGRPLKDTYYHGKGCMSVKNNPLHDTDDAANNSQT